jgi:outer membrane protein OmpA-like peptidoglycan-associated protein
LPELLMTFASTLVKYRQVLLATTVVSTIALPQIVSAFDGSDNGRIIVAQKDDAKKKAPPAKAPPPPQKRVAPPPKAPPPVQKQVAPPPPKAPPPVQKQVQPPKAPPPVQKQVTPPKAPPPVQKQVAPPKAPPPVQKQVQPPPGQPPQGQPQQKQVQPPPGQPPQIQPQQKQGQGQPGKPQPKQVQQPPVQIQKFGAPKAPPPEARVGNVNELKGKRREERQGNTVVIVEPGNRRIFRQGNRVYIRHDEGERMRRWGNARFETRGNERYTIVNRGGYDVVTITDGRGHMLRRYRRFPDGREYALIDNRRRFATGAAVVGGAVLLGLAAPRILIPRDRYIVDAGQAPPTLLYETLDAPPEVPPERAYSLDEIRDNVELRDRVRSVDINTINFSSGSWEVSPDQVPQLQALAEAMLKVIQENPSTVFMLEGHTDAVGSAEDNASLSDRRAEAVAEILTTNFSVPPENLVTQGYGEQYLRVQTEGPSRENRRVQVRNITGLMAGADGQPGGPPDGQPQGQPPG